MSKSKIDAVFSRVASSVRKLGAIVGRQRGGTVVSDKVNIFDVANYFLARVESDSGSLMTPLRLQKLVYYAQAWSLAILGEKLFEEGFRAWVHGPVNYELWQKYNGLRPIKPVRASMKKFSDDQMDLLDEVWDVYGQFDAKYLEELTHQELPWIEARKGYSPGERCSVVISTETMKKYYSSLLANGEG